MAEGQLFFNCVLLVEPAVGSGQGRTVHGTHVSHVVRVAATEHA
ncbi:hypothetical protein P3L51_04165 [Streptomyces sp. PSRA5]